MRDDCELIDACLSGDAAAFGQLVERYQHRLFHSLTAMVRSAEEAEDVAQEAFVQAFLKLDSFQRQSTFYTWLYRIAFNLAVSRGRRRRHEAVSVEKIRERSGGEPLDNGEAPHDRALREERAQQVREALAQLSDEHRSILVLREMEGCCYETIAEMLELPIGTVRSRLHRARLQMRDILKHVLADEYEIEVSGEWRVASGELRGRPFAKE